jgi:hypothetical protein
LKDYIQQHRQDGILWKANYLMAQAGTDIQQRDEAVGKIAKLVGLLPNAFQQEDYSKQLAKITGVKTTLINKRVQAAKEDVKDDKKKINVFKPDWADADEWMSYGFAGQKDGFDTGFYFADGGGFSKMTNFILTPIVHIYSEMPDDNVRVTELTNGFETRVIDMPTKGFLSTMDFENTVGNFGNYVGLSSFNKSHLNKIKVKLFANYPTCFELKTLGWQDEGFWAYSNIIYKDGLVKFNEYGIATIGGYNYISKSASVKKVMTRSGDDPFESDKFLKYKENNLKFKDWALMMQDVYGMTGNMGSAFALITLFRDLVFKVDNNCPMLYAYGEAQSGKSKFAESVANLFFNQMPAFNLNQGTDVAFWNRLMRFKNCPVLFNEFDENAIKEEWFRALKAVYDGEGRERGTIKKGKSDVQKVNCSVVLMGQYLSTKDDNSVLSRCIPISFKKQNERSKKVLKAYDDLKKVEENGLSSILCEILAFRELVTDRYASTLGEVKTQMVEALRGASLIGETRIVGNFSHLLAMCKLLGPKIGFSVSYDEFFNHCFTEVCKLSSMMSESNVLSDFWKTVEVLLDRQQIESGYDYKIENVRYINKMVNRTSSESQYFEADTEVIYIRLNNVHTQYMQLKRSSTGKNGINLQTIEMYMKDQPYYLGTCKSTVFTSHRMNKKMNTSAMMLLYQPDRQSNLFREYERSAPVKVEERGVDEVVGDDKLPF